MSNSKRNLSKRDLVTVDIGNSSSKIGVAENGSQEWISNWSGQIGELQRELLPVEEADWWICSVKKSSLDELQEWLKANRAADDVRVINRHDIPMQVNVETPGRVGVDRLVAAYAASIRYPDQDLVVVDAGTAVTIDAVVDGEFVGGTISPGSRIEFEALRRQTAQLPLLDGCEIPENVIGRSTEEAIRSGVLFGQVGSITFLAAEVSKQLKQPKVLATGGGAKQLQGLLPASWEFVPTLVLDGIRSLARNQKK